MLTEDVARKAIMGARIMNNGELLAPYGGHAPDDTIAALKVVQENREEFKQLVLCKLDTLPLFSRYFGSLVRTRLNQEGFLVSPLIGSIFDSPNRVEERLRIITESGVAGLEFIKKEYRHGSNSPTKGNETDKVARDLLAEILAIYFLVQLGFIDIERPYSQSQPHVDILAIKDGQAYAIEITRKQEIGHWRTLRFGNLEDCSHSDNLAEIRRVLRACLGKKNWQFARAIAVGTVDVEARKVVAIKTSDYGFAECSEQAETILRNLLVISQDEFEHIDCVWLLPNVESRDSKWICK